MHSSYFYKNLIVEGFTFAIKEREKVVNLKIKIVDIA